MNYHPVFAITVVLCALSLGAFAQNETSERAPAAVLIDEMKTSGQNCEEMLARLDVFFNELQNNPADQGYVIIYEEPSSRPAARRREYQLVNHVGFRRFDRGRLTLVRGSVRNDAVVQFWRVPAGAETPVVRAADSEFKEPEPAPRLADEPYIYATEHVDGSRGATARFMISLSTLIF